jgi:tetratricopeptide (TPR) repeat protein
MSNGRATDGVLLHELNARFYPDNVGAQFNLAEAYRYLGQNENAVTQYRHVLELAPEHGQAKARLELLGGS